MTKKEVRPALTPAMKTAIAVIGVLVLGGVITVAALTATGRPEASPDVSPSPAATQTSGPVPGATPTTGSEVQPPTASPRTGLPPLQPAEPLITAPLPDAGSLNGGLVTGFPAGVADPMEGSEVASSSIATEGTVMQLSLVASSGESPDAIRAHYRALWTSLGLRETSGDDDAVAFTGEYESLTLNVGTSGTGNLYTIFGVLRTE
jgi:hypothetical protein